MPGQLALIPQPIRETSSHPQLRHRLYRFGAVAMVGFPS